MKNSGRRVSADDAQSTTRACNPDKGKSLPFGQRLTCSVREACDATGLSRAKMYLLISDGSVSSTTVGRRRLVHIRSLTTLVLK